MQWRILVPHPTRSLLSNAEYLFLYVRVGRFQELLHLTGQVATHLCRTNCSEGTKRQRNIVVVAMCHVTKHRTSNNIITTRAVALRYFPGVEMIDRTNK